MSFWKDLLGRKESPKTHVSKAKATPASTLSDIHGAAGRGDLETVKALLKSHPDIINSKDENWMTPLHVAAKQGHKPLAEFLLANKAEVTGADITNNTALHWAAEKGYTDIVNLLLANGAYVNVRTSKTPLHVAAGANQKDVVELLIAKGADVNARDLSGETPFAWAMDRGYKEVADLLHQRVDAIAQETYKGPPLPDGWDDGCDEVVLLMAAAFSGTGFLVSQFMTPRVMMKLGTRLGQPAERARRSDLACKQIESLLTGPINKVDRNLSLFARDAADRIFRSRSRNTPSSIASLLSDMEDLARNNAASLSNDVIENCRKTWTGQHANRTVLGKIQRS